MTPAVFTMVDRTFDALPPAVADRLIQHRRPGATKRPGTNPPEYIYTFASVPAPLFRDVLSALSGQ